MSNEEFQNKVYEQIQIISELKKQTRAMGRVLFEIKDLAKSGAEFEGKDDVNGAAGACCAQILEKVTKLVGEG